MRSEWDLATESLIVGGVFRLSFDLVVLNPLAFFRDPFAVFFVPVPQHPY